MKRVSNRDFVRESFSSFIPRKPFNSCETVAGLLTFPSNRNSFPSAGRRTVALVILRHPSPLAGFSAFSSIEEGRGG